MMPAPRIGRLRLALLIGYVAVLLLVLGAGIAREEYYLRTGREIRLQSVPVDPVDLLRGQYVTLGYVAQDVHAVNGGCFDRNTDGLVYVTLDRVGDYWLPVDCEDQRRSRSSLDGDQVVLVARATQGWHSVRVEFPDTDRYYVPDGTAAPPKRPDVVLAVAGDGTARIKRLEVDGQVWP